MRHAARSGLEKTDRLRLRRQGVDYYYRSQPGVPTFDDRQQYWRPETPYAGVKTPDTGSQIRVKSMSRDGSVMDVEVKPAGRGPGRHDWSWDHGRWNWWD